MLVPIHPLSNIKIIKYFNYAPKFIGVYSRDNFAIKDDAYMINLDDKEKERINFHYSLTEI